MNSWTGDLTLTHLLARLLFSLTELAHSHEEFLRRHHEGGKDFANEPFAWVLLSSASDLCSVTAGDEA